MTAALRRAALLWALAWPAAAAAQAPPPPDALTYRVRLLDRGWRPPPLGPGELPELEVAGPAAVRVIHAPRLTWVVDAGRTPSLASARLFLDGHEAVTPGPGSLLLRGWEPDPGSIRVVGLERVRGDRDRTVAGRRAEHHTVRATLEGETPFAGRRRFTVTAHVWTLPGLPFSWAPFTADRAGLPWRFPALRDPLRRHLEPLGLAARAVVEVTEAPASGDPAPPEVTGFEIADLGRTGAPPVPGVVVDRELADALRRLAERRPRQVCAAARDGDLPGVIEARVDLDVRSSLLGFLEGHCAGRRW